jgi:hypothetical protein
VDALELPPCDERYRLYSFSPGYFSEPRKLSNQSVTRLATRLMSDNNESMQEVSSRTSHLYACTYHMCSQKCAKPLNDRGSAAAPTLTAHDMEVVLLSLSLITKHVTPFSSLNALYSLQSALPLVGVGKRWIVIVG